MPGDLFDHAAQGYVRRDQPLARRVAPRSLDELAGQAHVLGAGQVLRRAIEADRITSLIVYGPPGSGKTALARIIARRTKGAFEPLNAVTSGVKELRELIASAKQRQTHEQRRTIVFVDEIHRFNRAQQDALLPDVENGHIVLIGATTENPFFSVVAPLLSRSQIFQFRPLDAEALTGLLERALAHPERGLDDIDVAADPEALAHIARCAEGDARRALNALELALITTPVEGSRMHLSLDAVRACMPGKLIHYDGTGDAHYDSASALIKSLRGSNPDAALYWMARMIEAGESPRYIARRLCIAASEDVGNADPMAVVVAASALQASDLVGLPEARIILAQAAVYIALAPKSNAAYTAIDAALEFVRTNPTVAVPIHMRDAHYQGAKRLGHGKGYAYPHADPEGYVTQDYGIPRGQFYTPSAHGLEAEFAERLRSLDERDRQSASPPPNPDASEPEP